MIWELEGDFLRSDTVRDEQRTRVGGSRFPSPRTEKIEAGGLGQVQRITDKGAQHERRGRIPSKCTYHELERVVNSGHHVTGRLRFEGTSLKEGDEL